MSQINEELRLMLYHAAKNLAYEQFNMGHDTETVIKIHKAREAILTLIDPEFNPLI